MCKIPRVSTLYLERRPLIYIYIIQMDGINGFGQKARYALPVIVGYNQNITTHKYRLLREGQLTKCRGKGLRPVAGTGYTW
jgi:hypothetical protein